jgi:hypothetical protein
VSTLSVRIDTLASANCSHGGNGSGSPILNYRQLGKRRTVAEFCGTLSRSAHTQAQNPGSGWWADKAAREARVLRVGTLTSIGRALYPAIIDHFAKRQPGWQVGCRWMIPCSTATCWRVECRFVALSAGHPLAGRAEVSLVRSPISRSRHCGPRPALRLPHRRPHPHPGRAAGPPGLGPGGPRQPCRPPRAAATRPCPLNPGQPGIRLHRP